MVKRTCHAAGTAGERRPDNTSLAALRVACLAMLALALAVHGAAAQFRVPPYVQSPATDGMTVMWLSSGPTPGHLVCRDADTQTPVFDAESQPQRAEALAYTQWETDRFFDGRAPAPPWLHEVRVAGLTPGRTYAYTVRQGDAEFSSSFRTAPTDTQRIRFIVYADSETEPESTGTPAGWANPADPTERRVYPIDQTSGYARNLAVIRSRNPDFVVIAGDLVQHGGEQRDWDEFWRHNTHTDPALSLADSVPILPALGNHEYYAGNALGGYNQPHSERAVARYMTYFRTPGGGGGARRFYRLDYGPVAIMVLDVNNGQPAESESDTNFRLLGNGEEGGGGAPDFHAGSEQHRWLGEQLRQAQRSAVFTFVVCHPCPYSVGPHGRPAGRGTACDRLSGVPVRALTPLFTRYGVDAVLCGHDEMYERSEVSGQEIGTDGVGRPHVMHVYDVGIGGDGLRGPVPDLVNPWQRFLAHTHAPEVWKEGRLVEGGKHYGHLELEVRPTPDGSWEAVLTPAYVLPTGDAFDSFERRIYNDVVVLRGQAP